MSGRKATGNHKKSIDDQLTTNPKEDIEALLSTIDSLIATSEGTAGKVSKSASLAKTEPEPEAEPEAEAFVPVQLEEIEKGREQNLPIELYAQSCYNWMQMREIRRGLLENLDTKRYANVLYSAQQMHEIRLGLLDRLEVSSYARLVLSASDMQKARKEIFAETYRLNPDTFGRVMEADRPGIKIRISDDCLNAYVKLENTFQGNLTEQELLNILQDFDIHSGLISSGIQKLVKHKPLNREIQVAAGQKAQAGTDGWFQLFFDNNIEKGQTVPPEGEIDYTDVNTVDSIRPGDVLIQYHPAQKGTAGVTVTGIPIPGIDGKELPHLSGRGFRYDQEQHAYLATEKGYASYNDTTNSLNVWNVYNISGDVCYYQSLQYDGAVHIHGSVRNMSMIQATGDIIVDGFLENAFLHSEQNIVIKGGANGGGQGKIEAGGSIRGKFFENLDIKANGLVEGNYFFNCNITTDDRLIAHGRKARILGGKADVAISIEAVMIGNYLSKRTIFTVGDLSELSSRIHTLEGQLEKDQENLNQLNIGQQRLLSLLGPEIAKGNSLYTKTCTAIQIKENHVQAQKQEIERLNSISHRAEKAYVRIHGELQADVIFIINGVRKRTEKTIHHGVFLTSEKLNRG